MSDDGHYSQHGDLFRLKPEVDQQPTVSNIVGVMRGISGPKREEIIVRRLCHFFRADVKPGMGVAQGLDVQVDMRQCVPAAMESLQCRPPQGAGACAKEACSKEDRTPDRPPGAFREPDVPEGRRIFCGP